MATLRELKGRIGSVASSEKITGAMKMISSAKMHRAEATCGGFFHSAARSRQSSAICSQLMQSSRHLLQKSAK